MAMENWDTLLLAWPGVYESWFFRVPIRGRHRLGKVQHLHGHQAEVL